MWIGQQHWVISTDILVQVYMKELTPFYKFILRRSNSNSTTTPCQLTVIITIHQPRRNSSSVNITSAAGLNKHTRTQTLLINMKVHAHAHVYVQIQEQLASFVSLKALYDILHLSDQHKYMQGVELALWHQKQWQKHNLWHQVFVSLGTNNLSVSFIQTCSFISNAFRPLLFSIQLVHHLFQLNGFS